MFSGNLAVETDHPPKMCAGLCETEHSEGGSILALVHSITTKSCLTHLLPAFHRGFSGRVARLGKTHNAAHYPENCTIGFLDERLEFQAADTYKQHNQ